MKPVTPAIIHEQFNTRTESEIRLFFNLDDAGWERMRAMHEMGMETHRFSLHYFLMVEAAPNRVIGECGFHSWNRTHHRAELFYALKHDSDKRKGYTSEALEIVLTFGFSQLDLHRVEALTAKDNWASLAVLRKFGFRYEGIRREDYNNQGNFVDSESYSLLAHEWPVVHRTDTFT